jgi:hypothetical protein
VAWPVHAGENPSTTVTNLDGACFDRDRARVARPSEECGDAHLRGGALVGALDEDDIRLDRYIRWGFGASLRCAGGAVGIDRPPFTTSTDPPSISIVPGIP